ncbi:MAG: hypothetical protein GY805_21380 [Chloroflexi bacterium]|nr:hypothetical protein [Chloroflexota bacterium]
MKRLLIVFIILIGAYFRFHRLATFPPSSGWDTAYYGVDALRILDGDRPIYLYPSREALYSYVTAFMVGALGVRDFTLHLTAVFIGILTLPAVYLVTNELFYAQKYAFVRRYGGLIAITMLAVSYWHVVWSRFGVRAILAPLFIALTVYAVLRAVRTGRRTWFIIAGGIGGGSLYTYQVAQLLPILVFFIIVILYIANRYAYRGKVYLANVSIMFVASLLVTAPLLAFAYNNPEMYNGRVRDVILVNNNESAQAKQTQIKDRLTDVARFFFVEGDTDLRDYSVNGRVGLHPIFQIGLVVGLAVLVWQWRQSYALILLSWLLIMLIPASLADKASVSKRALGAIPAVAVIVALGLLTLAQFIHAGLRRLTIGPTYKWGLIIVLLFVGFGTAVYATYHDYFLDYALSDETLRVYDPQISEMAHYIAQLPPDELVYITPEDPHHPNMLYHTQLRTESSQMARGFNGWHCLVMPMTTQQPTTYVASENNSIVKLQTYYPKGQLQTTGLSDEYGYDDYFAAYAIEGGETAVFHPDSSIDANWSGQIQLIGYDFLPSSYKPGEKIEITLYLHALQKMDTNYTVFMHLIDPVALEQGQPPLRGQQDVEPCQTYYPTSVWYPEEVVIDTYEVTIDPNTQPGIYQLVMGFYTWYDQQRLAIGDNSSFVIVEIQVDTAD